MEYRCEENKAVKAGDQDGKGINNQWEALINNTVNAATRTIGCNNRKKIQKPRVTQEMTEKMEERRKWKSVNTEEGQKRYRQWCCAREKWWAGQCAETEELERQGRSDLLYRKVSQLVKGRKNKGYTREHLTENNQVQEH